MAAGIIAWSLNSSVIVRGGSHFGGFIQGKLYFFHWDAIPVQCSQLGSGAWGKDGFAHDLLCEIAGSCLPF